MSAHKPSPYATPGAPLAVFCDECGAQPGEDCHPSCTAYASTPCPDCEEAPCHPECLSGGGL